MLYLFWVSWDWRKLRHYVQPSLVTWRLRWLMSLFVCSVNTSSPTSFLSFFLFFHSSALLSILSTKPSTIPSHISGRHHTQPHQSHSPCWGKDVDGHWATDLTCTTATVSSSHCSWTYFQFTLSCAPPPVLEGAITKVLHVSWRPWRHSHHWQPDAIACLVRRAL